jgi:hypothetical protein
MSHDRRAGILEWASRGRDDQNLVGRRSQLLRRVAQPRYRTVHGR